MPVSKRAKLVSLTRTKQTRRENKSKLLDAVRAAAETFAAAYVFSLENLRSERFKELRASWADSRFFLGKNRLMALALGETPESAHRPALDALAADVHGAVGLLFTDRAAADVAAFFDAFGEADFARAGFVPSATVTVPPGKLELPHTLLEQLRKLGMPVRLDKGALVLPQSYSLCTAGKALTPEQGRLLKHFGHKLAVFKVDLISTVRGGAYTTLLSPEAALARSVFTKKHKRPSGRRAAPRAAGAGDEGAGGDDADEDGEGADEDGAEDDEEDDAADDGELSAEEEEEAGEEEDAGEEGEEAEFDEDEDGGEDGGDDADFDADDDGGGAPAKSASVFAPAADFDLDSGDEEAAEPRGKRRKRARGGRGKGRE